MEKEKLKKKKKIRKRNERKQFIHSEGLTFDDAMPVIIHQMIDNPNTTQYNTRRYKHS